jgi:hypothetical protein
MNSLNDQLTSIAFEAKVIGHYLGYDHDYRHIHHSTRELAKLAMKFTDGNDYNVYEQLDKRAEDVKQCHLMMAETLKASRDHYLENQAAYVELAIPPRYPTLFVLRLFSYAQIIRLGKGKRCSLKWAAK